MRRSPVLLVVLVLLAGACHGKSTPAVSAVPTSLPTPAGITPRAFAPADLGASVMTPATWQPTPGVSGFNYSLRDAGSTHAFLLATVITPPEGTTPARMVQRRATFLKTLKSTIESTATTTVDGHGAARLRYRLALPGQPEVEDVEYDIARGPAFVIIVLGERAPATDTALFDWIISTVRVAT